VPSIINLNHHKFPTLSSLVEVFKYVENESENRMYTIISDCDIECDNPVSVDTAVILSL
jgi:hypothetical protein